jgi:hypothetical protein
MDHHVHMEHDVTTCGKVPQGSSPVTRHQCLVYTSSRPHRRAEADMVQAGHSLVSVGNGPSPDNRPGDTSLLCTVVRLLDCAFLHSSYSLSWLWWNFSLLSHFSAA